MDLRIVDDERLDPPRKVPLSWPYVRNSVGEWEYEWGGLVPGARDLRISDRFSFALEDGKVLVPAEVWQREPVLSWCAAYWDPRGPKEEVLRVPISAWIAHDEVVGMTAPEVSPSRTCSTRRPSPIDSVPQRGRWPPTSPEGSCRSRLARSADRRCGPNRSSVTTSRPGRAKEDVRHATPAVSSRSPLGGGTRRRTRPEEGKWFWGRGATNGEKLEKSLTAPVHLSR